jgi:hypothetical protein
MAMSGWRAASPGSSRLGRPLSLSAGRHRRAAGNAGFVHLNHGHFGNGASTPIIHSNGKFYVHWDGGRLLAIDDETMAIVSDTALGDNVGGGGSINFRNFKPGIDSIWIGFSEIDLTDGSTIRTVAPYDWKVEDSNAGPAYDPTLNALISHPQFPAC